jgi:RNA polymerase sigma factor (sigma-70 family)
MMQPGSMVMDDGSSSRFAPGARGTSYTARRRRTGPGSSHLTLERTARVWDVFALARPRLVLLARRRLVDATLSEDAVHDAVEGAIHYCVLMGVEDEAGIVAALRNAVGWRCGELNRLATRARLQFVADPDQAAPDDAAATAEAAELRAAMSDILARLSRRDRRALQARTVGLSYAGVASEIGATERQAERAVERALRRVRLLYAARAEGQLCEEASELLPLLAAGTLDAAMETDQAALVRQHAEGCLRCRMEQRFYRRSVAEASATPSSAEVLSAG